MTASNRALGRANAAVLAAVAVYALALTSASSAQQPVSPVQEQASRIWRQGSPPITAGSPTNFSGQVQVAAPFRGSRDSRLGGATVTFQPGARSAWHRHPLGQALIVTEGCGWTQREGGPIETICAGDVSWIAPGEKHWHGATLTTAMTHVAVSESVEGKRVEWLEKVSDEHYARGPAASDASQQELMKLSRQKWLWMAERNTAALDQLFDDQAMFVHMGATMTKAQELDVIKSGRIQYKQADIQEISVKTSGDTAIVLSRIELFALVGGNEARNPFTVTETYIKQAGAWKLAALAFTRRLTPQ